MKSLSIRTLCSSALVAAAGLLPLAAPAQVIGVYQGVTSQGQTIEIHVIDDGNGGLAFGGGVVFWQATCTRSGPGRSVAWGVGTSIPLTGQTLNTEFNYNMLYERWRLTFGGNNVSGNFIGRTPEFVDTVSSTRQVQLCDSSNLSFNATLVPGARARALPAAGQATVIPLE